MTRRVCTGCREPFTRTRTPVAEVPLRKIGPGRVVPTLEVQAWGKVCSRCAKRSLPGAESWELYR